MDQLELQLPPVSFKPGRLVVSDEGGEFVHIDLYRDKMPRARIEVSRETLRLYAQRFLEAANRFG